MFERLRDAVRDALVPANVAPMSLQQLWKEPVLTPDEIENFCEVVDRQSDTTIICFAGLALNYAGLPSYEFRKSLGVVGERYNLIFVRDVRRLWYHVAPDGTPNGLDFYGQQLQARVEALGSTRLLTIGVSAGGYAALYFGWRLGAKQILSFSPQADLVASLDLNPLQLYWCDRKSRHFRTFLKEELMVAIALRRRTRLLKQQLATTAWGELSAAAAEQPNTRVDVYYCRDNALDTQEANTLLDYPGITLHACDCNQHNCAGYLRDQAQLFEVLQTHLQPL